MTRSNLEVRSRLNALSAGSEVGVDKVQAATQLILNRGVSHDRVELFTDVFLGAAMEGRLPENARQAYVDGLLQMVDALPADGVAMVAVRTERALTQELQTLERAIDGYMIEIGELDRQIAETNARVSAKLNRVNELSSRRSDLLRQIETANRRKQGVFVFAAILGIVTIGLGAPIAGAIGAVSVVGGIAATQHEIDRVRNELNRVDAESAELRALSESFTAQRQNFEASVAALRTEETALRQAADAAEGETPQVRLAVEVIIARTLANNLQQQIHVLRAQLKSARQMEQQVDGILKRLESEVTALERRAEDAHRELLETILATVLTLARLNPFAKSISVSKAKLLTRGIDYLGMSFRAQVKQVLENAVVQGLLQSSTATFAAKSILSVVDIFGDGSLDRGTLSADETSVLSSPQSYLLDLIARSRADIDHATETETVRRSADLTDDEARREAKRLIKTLRPAAALMPIGKEIGDWRKARALALEAEQAFRRIAADPDADHGDGLEVIRRLAASAQAKLRPDTPPHRALGMFHSALAPDRSFDPDYAGAGLYAALAILSLDA